GLEQIRACVHRWVDRIEGQLSAAGLRPTNGPDLERAVSELEEQREAMRLETSRREKEWAEQVEALEHDRRLLAEAWERLEQARVAAVPSAPEPAVVSSQARTPRAVPAADRSAD